MLIVAAEGDVDVVLIFFVDWRIFFSLPLLTVDEEEFEDFFVKYLLSLFELFLILSLLFIIKLDALDFFTLLGFRGLPVAVVVVVCADNIVIVDVVELLLWFWCVLYKIPSGEIMLFELSVPFVEPRMGVPLSSPDDAVDVPNAFDDGESSPLLLHLSQ